MADTDITVREVHPMAMRSKEMRELSTNLLAWISTFLHRRDNNAIRDPTKDCTNGVLVFWFLEEVTGGQIARYNADAMSDRAMIENLSVLCLALKRLDVQPVGDGGWTPQLLFSGNAIAWWSLLVALALRFNCDRFVRPSVFLATKLMMYHEKEEVPFAEKTVRTILTPSADEMDAIRAGYAEKYGFVVAKPIRTFDQLGVDELTSWVNSYLSQRSMTMSSSNKRPFGEGIKLLALLEVLTGMTTAQVLGETVNNPAESEEDRRENIELAFAFMENLGIDHHNCGVEDIMEGAVQPVYRLIDGLRDFDFSAIQASALDAVTALHEDEDFVASQRAAIQAQMVSAGPAANIAAAAAAVAEDEPPPDAPPMYSDMEDPDAEFPPDVFDKLFAADVTKLNVVKDSMKTFTNAHLSRVNIEVADLSTDFSDGVVLIALVSLLHNAYIDPKFYHLHPKDSQDKLENLRFAIARVKELGLDIPQVSAAKLLSGDVKTVLRLLYVLHRKFR